MEERQPVGVDGGDGKSAVLTEYRPSAADAVRSVCPFLIAATGDWRLAAPTREHRCAAFAPLTSLSLDKQARLCLAASHVSCATYKASVAARAERAGAGEPEERAGRWGLARTAPLIEDTGGLLGTLITMIADRRTWPAIPAVLLVATLIAVGISGVRGEGQAAAVATATPGATPGAEPTEPSSFVPTLESSPPPTGAPSPQASAGPAASGGPTPAPSYLIYTVQTGDTLSSIATKFHTTVSALEKLNNITNPRSLHVGQKLKIP